MAPRDIRVLIGEDDGIVSLDMATRLSRMGYAVQGPAETPEQVVVLTAELRPDVIVLDLNIQGDMHGLEVAREIHQIANIPIVFVSAYSKDVLDNVPVIPTPYRYVVKPFVLSELHAAIQDLLDGLRP